jgi:hypothetical protein
MLLATSMSHAAEPETGSWSEPVEGVRGRIIVAEDPKVNGTIMLAVYLELQNVSDVANPIEIYFDPDRTVQCQLLDANNKPAAISGLPASIMQPPPFWLSLPYDSSMRFRVSVSGYGVPKDAGRLIPMTCGDWIIKADDHAVRSLEVTLNVSPPKATSGHRAWRGTIKMPGVKIPH